MPAIRQICATSSPRGAVLFALDELSNVWMLEAPGLAHEPSDWRALPTLPQPKPKAE